MFAMTDAPCAIAGLNSAGDNMCEYRGAGGKVSALAFESAGNGNGGTGGSFGKVICCSCGEK
jgi:hypothetical protein